MTIEEMRSRYAKGESYQQIADDAGVTKQRIHQLVKYGHAGIAARQRERRRRIKATK